RRSQAPRDAAPALGDRRGARARAARVRLQPGPDGLRRDGLRRAPSAVPRLSDDLRLPHVPRLIRRGHAPSRRRRARPGAAAVKTIVVAAAVMERDGRFLVTRRQPGVHLAGYWEFPGGKCEPDEAIGACLQRELREELAIEAEIAGEILATSHAYGDRIVELHFVRC